jgi:hypothetical protein
VRYWFGVIFLLLAVAACAPQVRAADPIPIGARACTLAGQSDAAPGDLFGPAPRFDCSDRRFEIATETLWIRVDLRGVGADLAEPVLRARTSRHGAIDLHRRFADGGIEASHHSLADMTARWRSPSAIALPFARASDNARPEQLLIRVEHPFDPPNWADLELVSAARDIALDRRGRG